MKVKGIIVTITCVKSETEIFLVHLLQQVLHFIIKSNIVVISNIYIVVKPTKQGKNRSNSKIVSS